MLCRLVKEVYVKIVKMHQLEYPPYLEVLEDCPISKGMDQAIILMGLAVVAALKKGEST